MWDGGTALRVVRGKQEALWFWVEWWFILTVLERIPRTGIYQLALGSHIVFLLHTESPNLQQRYFKQAEAVLSVSRELGAAQLLSS